MTLDDVYDNIKHCQTLSKQFQGKLRCIYNNYLFWVNIFLEKQSHVIFASYIAGDHVISLPWPLILIPYVLNIKFIKYSLSLRLFRQNWDAKITKGKKCQIFIHFLPRHVDVPFLSNSLIELRYYIFMWNFIASCILEKMLQHILCFYHVFPVSGLCQFFV